MKNIPCRQIDLEDMVKDLLNDDDANDPAELRQAQIDNYMQENDDQIDRAFQSPPGFLSGFNAKGFGMRFQVSSAIPNGIQTGFEVLSNFEDLLLILNSEKSCKICPFCFENCKKIEEKILSFFQRETNKHYLCHVDCFQRKEELQLENLCLAKNKQNHFYPCSYETFTQYLIPYPSFRTSDKRAFLEVSLFHCISSLKLIEITRQVSFFEDEKTKMRMFDIELNKTSRYPFYKPNYYILPMKEFRLEISLRTFGSSNKEGEEFKGIVDICEGDSKTPDKFNKIYRNLTGNAFLMLDIMKTKFNLIESQANFKLDFFTQKTHLEEVFVLLGLHLFLPKEKPSLSATSQNFEGSVKNPKMQQQYTPPMRASDAPANIAQEMNTNPFNLQRGPVFESVNAKSSFTLGSSPNIQSVLGGAGKGMVLDSPIKGLPSTGTKGSNPPPSNGGLKLSKKSGMLPGTGGQQINQRALYLTEERANNIGVKSNTSSVVLTNDDSTTQNSPISSKNREELVYWPKDEGKENEEDPEVRNVPEIHSYDELGGSLLDIMKTQQGSRVLQKYLVSCPQSDLDKVFSEIENHICKIMMDQYANYMFQTLCQRCTSQQRMVVLEKIAPEIINMACDKKGTHALQALVSIITCDLEEDFIIQMVKGSLPKLIMDPQGTHFIQKIVARFPIQKIEIILQSSVENFLIYVQGPCGVCVLKALLTKFKDNQQMIAPLFSLLIRNLDSIVQNPYGNYAIQHAVDVMMDDPNYNVLMQKLLSKVLQLSNHKFSSNVIERCIVYASNEFRKKFIESIAQESVFIELMKNKYGNFVLTKCFNMASAQELDLLMNSLYKTLPLLHIPKYKSKWIDFLHNNNRGF